MSDSKFSHHLPLMTALAKKAIGAAPTHAMAGGQEQADRSITVATPAAWALVTDEPVAAGTLLPLLRTIEMWAGQWSAPSQPPPQAGEGKLHSGVMLREPSGHGRPVYWPLVLHLAMVAWEKCRVHGDEKDRQAGDELLGRLGPWMQSQQRMAGDIAMGLWWALVDSDGAMLAGDRQRLAQAGDRVQGWLELFEGEFPGGALHPLDPEQSLDSWTYQEFTGLHALMNLAIRHERSDWLRRVTQVAEHHVINTQPDNTTTQPWGLLAFLNQADTTSLGEQQLHDAQMQGLNLLTGLLLADAVGLAAHRL